MEVLILKKFIIFCIFILLFTACNREIAPTEEEEVKETAEAEEITPESGEFLYTNKEEGFSFRHPSDWRIATDDEIFAHFSVEGLEMWPQAWIDSIAVFFVNEHDNPENAINLEINRFTKSRYERELIFTAQRSVFEENLRLNHSTMGAVDVPVLIIHLYDFILDDVPARKLIFVQNNIYHIRIYYAVNDIMYLLTFRSQLEGKLDLIAHAVLDSFKITTVEDTSEDMHDRGDIFSEVLLNGIPIGLLFAEPFYNILGYPSDFGAAFSLIYDGFEIMAHPIWDDDFESFTFEMAERVSVFGANLNLLEIYGSTLYKTFEEFVALLGDPVEYHRYPSGHIYRRFDGNRNNTIRYHIRTDRIDYMMQIQFEWNDILPDGSVLPEARANHIGFFIYNDVICHLTTNDTLNHLLRGRPTVTYNGAAILY